VISADDEGTFQAAVLERLRAMCGEHEDAKVLAEYIVVMVAGNKGREEMAVELKPFFQDQAQAESFVDWVEDCKWKFLTGGSSLHGLQASPGGSLRPPSSPPSPLSVPEVPALEPSTPATPAVPPSIKPTAASATAAAPAEAPRRAARAPLAAKKEPWPARMGLGNGESVFEVPTASSATAVRPGPHVAVTSRVVLQPSPAFNASTPGQALPPSKASPAPAAPSGTGPAFSKAAAASRSTGNGGNGGSAVKRDKNELLESMTKQLQLILTKLNNKSLADEMRERYQALAQNIQTQMAKISCPPVRKRP